MEAQIPAALQPPPKITYSDRYADDVYEYRHVILPKSLAKILPHRHLLTETEWRNIGVQQSPGWIHYMFHAPEPHILLFRREKANPTPSDFGRHAEHLLTEQIRLNRLEVERDFQLI